MRARVWLAGATVLAVALTGCALSEAQPPAPAPAPAAQSTTTTAPQPSATHAEQAQPAAPAVLKAGSVGERTRELQARLRQLGHYEAYDVNGLFSVDTQDAVKEFQEKSGLKPTGIADDATWKALEGASKKPTEDELANRVDGRAIISQTSSAEEIRETRHRLIQMKVLAGELSPAWSGDITAAVKQFQTAQNLKSSGVLDQRTWDRLLSLTRMPTIWEITGTKPPVSGAHNLDSRCLKGRVICVSMAQHKVSWVIDGKILLTMDARFGSKEHPTYKGEFRVWLKNAKAVSTIFEDVAQMPWSMFFDRDRAVHFSSEFVRDGYTGTSHGCVNTRDFNNTKWLFEQVRVGDRVIVY